MLPRFLMCLLPSKWRRSAPSADRSDANPTDHREFIAMLYAPYLGDGSGTSQQTEARRFLLNFSYRYVRRPQDVLWLLEIVAPDGKVIRAWHRVERLSWDQVIEVAVKWDGFGRAGPLPAGIYLARLLALSRTARTKDVPRLRQGAVRRALRHNATRIEQSWELRICAQHPGD